MNINTHCLSISIKAETPIKYIVSMLEEKLVSARDIIEKYLYCTSIIEIIKTERLNPETYYGQIILIGNLNTLMYILNVILIYGV